MTLQECYAAMGGDYQGVMGRLPSERMVQKFVLKFLNDGSYDLLLRSMEEAPPIPLKACARIWILPRSTNPAASSAKPFATVSRRRRPPW